MGSNTTKLKLLDSLLQEICIQGTFKMSAVNKLSLRWNEFQNVTSNAFSGVFKNQNFTDVTLASKDGEHVSAHKIILSSSSAVFEKMFSVNTDKHLLIYLRGCTMIDLEYLLRFIYVGEVEIERHHVERFLQTARDFEIRGVQNYGGELLPAPINSNDLHPNKFAYDENLLKEEADYNSRKRSALISVESDLKSSDEGNLLNFNDNSSDVVVIDEAQEDSEHGKALVPVETGSASARKKLKSRVSEVKADFDIEEKRRSNSWSRTYDCEVCGRQLASQGSLFNHRKSKHEGVTYSCDFCEYKAGQAAQLRGHKLKYHSEETS